jgi:peptidoglycan/LPS O-acetylase OafA/YrhL
VTDTDTGNSATLLSAAADRPVSTDSFGYQPALDGIRGIAIAVVLAFHGGWSWMTGGYVGVSVFFTLSGFLITTLLLLEHDRTGRVDIGRFVGRRVRRLLPASLVCLAVIVVCSWRGWFVATDRLRGDIVAAALQVANWRALTGQQSYADLVAASAGVVGPVDHFWSLSIEEQFYWVWPLASLGLFARWRHRNGRIAALALATTVAAVAAVVIARRWGADAAYWSTPARLGEILVGALLAAVVRGRTMPRWCGWSGVVGLAVVLWAAITWPSGSGPAYTGWLPVFALASAAVIAGVQVPGLLRRACSWRPLVWLGTVSYGVYLYHWPLFALLDSERTRLDGWPLFLVRLTVTLAVAAMSARWLEQPIRRRQTAPRRTLPVAVAATVAVVALAWWMVPRPEPTFAGDVDTTDVGFLDAPTTAAPPDSAPTTSPAAVPGEARQPIAPPVRMLLIGDSTAVALGAGLVEWARAVPDSARVESVATIGCGVIVEARVVADTDGTFQRACSEAMGPRLDAALATGNVDMAVVLVSLPDAGARVWTDAEGAVAPQDPRYVDRRAAAYDALVARLVDAGVPRIVWLTPPVPARWWVGYEPENTNRVDVEGLVTAVDDLGMRHPGVVDVVPFGAWLAAQEADGDRSWRTDGLHLDPTAATRVMTDELGPALQRLAGE